jgi:DNA-binding MarR family transcriptional regulator
VLVALAGCGAGGRLDETELKAAIDAHLAESPRCIEDVAWRFPVDLRSEYDRRLEPHHATMMARLERLEQLGLVRSAPVPNAAWGRPRRYELTDAGEKVYRAVPAGRMNSSKPAGSFCYGVAVVDSVVRYTEPTEGAGEVQTEVTYTSRVADVAPWARDPDLRRLSPEIERVVADSVSPQETRSILVRTSDGWRVATRG